MPLKYTIGALDDVAENVRGFYVKREDGKFVLDAEGATSTEKLTEFRNNNIELQKQLDKLKDIDPEKYRELVGIQQQINEKKLIEAGKIEEVIEQRVRAMKDEHKTQLHTMQTQLGVANRQLETLLIDNEVKSAAVKEGVLPTAVDDVVLRAKTAFSIEAGRPVMKDGKGQVVYGEDGTTPMSIGSWAKDLKKTAPHLFAGFTGSGAGGSGQAGGRPNSGAKTALEKIAAGLPAIAREKS